MDRLHKDKGLLEYKCFFEKRGLMNHTATVHEEQKAHICEICDKIFIHKRIHEGPIEYKCGKSKARFFEKKVISVSFIFPNNGKISENK